MEQVMDHTVGKSLTPLKAGVVRVTPFEQNCTLIWDEATKIGAVVDPGGDLDRIEAAIAQTGMTVSKILLTHGHIDHAGGAAELRDKLGVKIEAAQYGLSGVRNVSSDRWLDDGDTVEVAGHTFEIFHCPGHSPGSVVFFDRGQHFAIVGDVLFNGSIGRTDFPYGDHEALITAIKTKLLPLGDDIAFICGHGPPSRFGDERQSNPFLV
jgi:hydroxyacylglutathione hydrolase